MATSLAEQLKRLQAPQTTLLLQDKKRVSLLFDPKEAANFDRLTFYELGVSGLEELKTLNFRFSDFETTLFDMSSQFMERAVLSEEVNRKLDKTIKRFFYLLSPYFLLKSAHKALEWLINRFHIHQYNVDDLLMLALPYHESLIFVRVVQLIDLSNESNRWYWLKPIQKQGVPLSKMVLINHAFSSDSFVSLLCETTMGAVQEHSQYAGVLSTLLAFYTSTLVGVFNQSLKGASETKMTKIIESLICGLQSMVLDFAAAAYLVLGRLVVSTSISPNFLRKLVKHIISYNHPELKVERAMLLALIYERQKHNITEVRSSSIIKLSLQPESASSFGTLASKGFDVVPFIMPLMRGALDLLQNKSTTERFFKPTDMFCWIENLVNEIHFSEAGAESVIRIFIEAYDASNLKAESQEIFMQWFYKILKQLERSYPSVFDKSVSRALKGLGVSESQADGLRQILGFEIKLDFYEKLHHQNSSIRAEALLCLAKKCGSFKEKDENVLRDCLLDVLSDESDKVVKAALSFPITVLQQIISRPVLHAKLIGILQTRSDRAGSKVIASVISALTVMEKGEDAEELECLVYLLPYMLNNDEHLRKVVNSPFGLRNKFIEKLKLDCQAGRVSLETFCNAFANNSEALELQSLLELGRKLLQEGNCPSRLLETKFSLLLLLGSALPQVAPPQTSLEVLQLASDLIKGYEVCATSESRMSPSSLRQSLLLCKKGKGVPLEGYIFVILKVINQTKQAKLDISLKKPLWFDLETQCASTKLIVQLYCSLLEGCAQQRGNAQSLHTETLRAYFETYFPDIPDRISFLAHFWCSHRVVDNSKPKNKTLSLDVQVRSLRISALLITNWKTSSQPVVLSTDSIVLPALLTALCCPTFPVRRAALDVVGVLASIPSEENSLGFLMRQIQGSEPEINMDADQLQLVLYTNLSPDPIVRKMLPQDDVPSAHSLLNALLDVVVKERTPLYISAAVLSVLTSVNSDDILKKLLPVVLNILSSWKGGTPMNVHGALILQNIVNRIDAQTAHVFEYDLTWKVLTELLARDDTIVLIDGRKTCPAEIACNQITRDLWEALPNPQYNSQLRLLSLLIDTGTEAENPLVLPAVTKCVKQLTLDASLVVTQLNKMMNASVPLATPTNVKRRSIAVTAPSPLILQTKEWRCGITLLEFIQNKKKLNNVQLLIPVLFGLLKKCLSFEEQAQVEYVKQLVLTCLSYCCQKLSPDGERLPENLVPTKDLDVAKIVDCVQSTKNPQTHHHALLLLAQVAAFVPDQMLLNIMPIFTFVGSVCCRHDDAYSFHVITKIVDTIIPIIKDSHSGALSKNVNYHPDATIASIMSVFVNAILDIPEHRRLPLFHRLLSSLNPEQYLWMFLCLVMESHTHHHSNVASDSKKTKSTRTVSEAPKRIEVALQIITQFNPEIILSNCVMVLQYLMTLPMEKGIINNKTIFKNFENFGNTFEYSLKALFNVDDRSAKELRHYKYTIVTFISALLSSLPFVNQVTSLGEEAVDTLVPVLLKFVEVQLVLIQVFSRQSDMSSGTPTSKYWKIMVAQTYDILDKISALVPSKVFVSTVRGLMVHQSPTLRRKAMELLNSRLSSSQREEFLASCDSGGLLVLLEPLTSAVASIEKIGNEELNEEIFLNQQTALLSIKYLAKHFAYNNYEKFKPILDNMTSLLREGQIQNANLLASVVLCAAELCSSLRAHAIAALPVLMPTLIELVAVRMIHTTDVVQMSMAAALFKIVDSLAPFMSPYLCELLVELCVFSASHFQEVEDQSRVSIVAIKLKSTRQKLSSATPTRVLVPAVENAYKNLISTKRFNAIGPLMNVLAENFVGLISADLVALQIQLTEFFLNALQFRSMYSSNPDISSEQIDSLEDHVIKAFIALVLKLSEISFRPLYFKFFEWAKWSQEQKERAITFYRLSSNVAENLKGLYVSFVGTLLKNAAKLLDHCNVSKIKESHSEDVLADDEDVGYCELYFGSDSTSENKCNTLVTNILKTFNCVFLYDSQNFLSKERFEILMPPIVDQLENTLGGVEALKQRASDFVIPCIAQMAVSCSDDTLWKQLNYQILLKTRHPTAMVRLVSLEAVCAVARKLGESFLPLLPETVPFLAELLEDEEESIENSCRRIVQDLEGVLGEPIEKYF